MTYPKLPLLNTGSSIKNGLLAQFGGYFDGDLYGFISTKTGLELKSAEKDFKPKLLIVAPCCYQERAHNFPLDDRRELKKLLQLQLKQDEISLIQKLEEGQSKVNSWLYANNVPRAFIRLPESLILGRYCQNGEVLQVLDKTANISCITQFDNVIYSAAMKGMINSSSRFAMSVGITMQQTLQLDYRDKAQALANGISNLKFNQLTAFITKASELDRRRLLLQTIVPGLGLLLMYLVISSGYLGLKMSSAENKLAIQEQQVSSLLYLQTDLDNKQTSYRHLTEFWKSKGNIAGLWVVMAPLFEQAQIRSISFQNDKFSIRGQTKRATSLLELISKNPNVQNARFETPVRKDRTGERFNLSFKLSKKLFIPENEQFDNKQGAADG